MSNKIQVFVIPTGLLFLSLFVFVKTQTTIVENVTNEEQPSVQDNSDIGFIMRITAQGFDYGIVHFFFFSMFSFFYIFFSFFF